MIGRAISVLPEYLKSWLVKMSNSFFEGYKDNLKNRLFGNVLCEREKSGEWEKALDAILIEVLGMKQCESINYYNLIYKLSSLRFLSYEYFRKTVFECMNLINTLTEDNELH